MEKYHFILDTLEERTLLAGHKDGSHDHDKKNHDLDHDHDKKSDSVDKDKKSAKKKSESKKKNSDDDQDSKNKKKDESDKTKKKSSNPFSTIFKGLKKGVGSIIDLIDGDNDEPAEKKSNSAGKQLINKAQEEKTSSKTQAKEEDKDIIDHAKSLIGSLAGLASDTISGELTLDKIADQIINKDNAKSVFSIAKTLGSIAAGLLDSDDESKDKTQDQETPSASKMGQIAVLVDNMKEIASSSRGLDVQGVVQTLHTQVDPSQIQAMAATLIELKDKIKARSPIDESENDPVHEQPDEQSALSEVSTVFAALNDQQVDESLKLKQIVDKISSQLQSDTGLNFFKSLSYLTTSTDDILNFIQDIIDSPELQAGEWPEDKRIIVESLLSRLDFADQLLGEFQALSPTAKNLFLNQAKSFFGGLDQIIDLSKLNITEDALVVEDQSDDDVEKKSSNPIKRVVQAVIHKVDQLETHLKEFISSESKLKYVAHDVESVVLDIVSKADQVLHKIGPSYETRSGVNHVLGSIVHKLASVNTKVVSLIDSTTNYSETKANALQSLVGFVAQIVTLAGGAAGIAATAYPPVAVASIPLAIGGQGISLLADEIPLILKGVDKAGDLNRLIGDLVSGRLTKIADFLDHRSSKLKVKASLALVDQLDASSPITKGLGANDTQADLLHTVLDQLDKEKQIVAA